MRHDDWGHGWNGGSWWWIPMTLMMIAVWAGLIWLAVTVIRRPNHGGSAAAGISPPRSTPPVSTARQILDERLARGEIETDEYRRRRDALVETPTA